MKKVRTPIVLALWLCALLTPDSAAFSAYGLTRIEDTSLAINLLFGGMIFFVLSLPLLLLIRAWAHTAKKRNSLHSTEDLQDKTLGYSVFFNCRNSTAEIFSILSLTIVLFTAPLSIAIDSKAHYFFTPGGPLAAAALVSPISLLLSLLLGLRSWYLMFLYGSAKDFSFADRRFYAFGFFYYALFLLIAYAAYRY